MSYTPKVYRKQGGDTTVVADGGNIVADIDGFVRCIRTRFTVAEVNAGATVLDAQAGFQYRFVSANLIAVGGAAATGTTVDILGTQSTAKKLATFAQADLTENTVLGEADATYLAAGASFVANDANTAITIGKTGSDFATATHFDLILSYTVEEA